MAVPSSLTDAPSPDTAVSIVAALTDPGGFARILADPAFAAIEAYPNTGSFGRAYHPAIHGDHDRSFAVSVGGVATLVCLCAPLDGRLAFYGLPLRLILRREDDGTARRIAIAAAFAHLDTLAEGHGARETSVLDLAPGACTAIAEASRARGAVMRPQFIARVDLAAGPAAWRAALRKSSRSLINWGRRNLTIGYVNRDTPDRAMFNDYRAFHAQVAGRTTRGAESWDVMFESIARGAGELNVAFLEGKLIAASMFIDGTETSVYASGVYDRTQFDKPLAHYPLWLGIERARERGLKTLELGEVPVKNTVPDKEYQIGYFKRGFATHIDEVALWRWPAPPPAATP
jgi:hypothetical protein